MTQEELLLKAIEQNPHDALLRLAYRDFVLETRGEYERWKSMWPLAYPTGGHRFWYDTLTPPDADREPRLPHMVAIADDSGRWPDETDDGVMWLNRRLPIVEAKFVPLVCEDGTVTCTVAGVREVEWLLAELGMEEPLCYRCGHGRSQHRGMYDECRATGCGCFGWYVEETGG